MPAGVTSSAGGSLNPSSGISCLSSSTNDSGPTNLTSPRTTSTSGLRPACAANSSFSKATSMKPVGGRRWTSKCSIRASTSDFGRRARASIVAVTSIFVAPETTKIELVGG